MQLRLRACATSGRLVSMSTHPTECVVQMPAATTLCIVNVQAEEAKVEALMDSFVSLRQEAALDGAKGGPEDTKNYFLYADDAEDNFQVRHAAVLLCCPML